MFLLKPIYIYRQGSIRLYNKMEIESQVSSSNLNERERLRFNFDALTQKSRWNLQNASELNQTEQEMLSNLPPALKECYHLRQQIEDSFFGCIFREPVNPHIQKLPDYWVKIRKPMDLLTVKRKFLIGIYRSHTQFHEDMRLMFTNFISYNISRTYLCLQAKHLFQEYQLSYQKIMDLIKKNQLEEETIERLNNQESIASRLDPTQLGSILTVERKKELGKLLQFLVNRNKVSLINTMTKMYPSLKITPHNLEQWIFLDDLTPHQIYDLLRLCQKMKAHDFDTAKLMTVRVDPLLQGYQEFQEKVSVSAHSDIQSQFEIESESEG